MVTRVHSLKLEKKTIPVGAECLCHKLRKYEDIKECAFKRQKLNVKEIFFVCFFLRIKLS